MRPRLDIRVLGPFEVRRDGELIDLRAKQRAVLALLLLRPNEVVPRDQLVEALWPQGAPAAAQNALQVYVSQLRKLLEPESDARTGAEVLLSRPPGYLLRLEHGELDSARFEALLEEGRASAAAGDTAEAVARLEEALELWRGDAYAELAYEDFALAEIARLQELHLEAAEARADAQLEAGQHVRLISQLEALNAQHPLRERLSELLMLALYRSGRQADSLEVFQRTRRLLADELGIDPSPGLQRLQRAVLNQDASLDPPPQAETPPQRAPPPAPARPRESRKTVTVLHARLSPDEAESDDPERQRSHLRRTIERLEQTVGKHGGHVDRRTADELTAVFGLPSVHEDDVLRAARAGLAAVHAETGARPHVGIATGSALVAESGERAWLVAGAPPTKARRLAHLAPAGEALVDDATREALRHVGRLEPSDADGGHAWQLLGVSGVDLFPRRHDTPLVGRRTELAQLEQAFARVERERDCHLFTLLGAAGVGKSRLAQELRRRVEGKATVVAGRSLSYGEGVTYRPLLDAVREAAGADVAEALREFSSGADEEAAIAPLLAAFGLAEGDPSRDEIFPASRRLLESLARDRPLVLVFDDLHWAEQTFLDLVEHVAASSRGAPILLLTLARPEFLDRRPAWGAGATNSTTLLLEPLDRDESRTLLDILAAGIELPPGAERDVLGAAEGNPLYIEQMLALARETGRDPIGIPPTIEALIAARLDLLPREERLVLELASIVGREFSTRELQELLAFDEAVPMDQLPELVASLARRRLIRPRDAKSGSLDGFTFEHQLVRDVAEATLTNAERATAHERVAELLLQGAEAAGQEVDDVVGYHFEQACFCRRAVDDEDPAALELAGRAAHCLAAAGERAYRRGDMPAAASLFGRAIALEPDEELRLRCSVPLGDALREIGSLAEAERTLSEAIATAQRLGRPELEGRATAIWLREQIQTAAAPVEELRKRANATIERLEQLGDDAALADAWTAFAWIPWVRCRAEEAEQAVERALEFAKRSGGHRERTFALNLYIGAAVFGPLPLDQGLERCHRILETPDLPPRVEALAYRALGALHAFAGEFDEGRSFLTRDGTIVRELGLPILEAVASEIWAMLELLAGRPEAAETKLREGMAILEPSGERSALYELGTLLAEVLYVQERDREALALIQEIGAYGAADDVSIQVKWRGPAAKLAARAGRFRKAVDLAREGVALAGETDFVTLQANAQSDLGDVLARAGRLDEADAVFREALALYERKGNRAGARRVSAHLRKGRARA